MIDVKYLEIRGGGKGVLNFFWQSVQHKLWNRYPYLRIFLPKMADVIASFEICKKKKKKKKKMESFVRVFTPYIPLNF